MTDKGQKEINNSTMAQWNRIDRKLRFDKGGRRFIQIWIDAGFSGNYWLLLAGIPSFRTV